ncbi:iron-containing alcohol dehydrogenase [Georgenia alba]|uniref:Iron-containing alcohol dehydrogenase n=1 Tax=Georgenia alba TaxID=2233858 RepID=A0ABW2Q4T0_9MICO
MVPEQPVHTVASEQHRNFAGLRSPGEIIFGSGQRHALAQVVQRLGSRAFLCVDPHIAGSPELDALTDGLRGAGITSGVYADVVPELPTANVMAAVTEARAHDADVVVAVGGGSSIDLAKVVSCLLAHGGEPADYYGEFGVPGPVLPLVAVPTTAGTGSEVTPVAVLTDSERRLKVGISSPYLIPTVAICDPELTITCPPAVTAASGVDALSHCIEALTAVRREPTATLMGERVFIGRGRLTDQLALAGASSIISGLHRAHAVPEDIRAREEVMYGSMLGGLAFGTAGTAAAHALQYPIGAATKTPHGVGIGLLLPYVMEYNRGACIPEFAQLAQILGAEDAEEETRARRAPGLVQSYVRKLGIPVSLKEIGFDDERIDWAAEQGLKSVRLAENNPVPLTVDGARRILQAAAHGDAQADKTSKEIAV